MACATLAVMTTAKQAETATPTLSPFLFPNALFFVRFPNRPRPINWTAPLYVLTSVSGRGKLSKC